MTDHEVMVLVMSDDELQDPDAWASWDIATEREVEEFRSVAEQELDERRRAAA